MKRIYIFCFLFCLSMISFAQTSKCFWLGINPSFSNKNIQETLRRIGVQKGCNETTQPFLRNGIGYIYKVFCDSQSFDEIIYFAKQQEDVLYAEPCQNYRLLSVPDDSVAFLWYLNQVNAYAGWDVSSNSRTTIAVVDDAIYINHPDLQNNIYFNPGEIRGNGKDDDFNGFVDDYLGYDVAAGDTDVNPPSGSSGAYMYHGTHVSGIAAGVTDNKQGIASLSRNRARIIPVKASALSVVLTHAEEGIAYALSLKPDILCLSFGGTDTTNYTTLRTLLKAASDSGIIVIAAAGNDGNETPVYPAAYPFVWAVGATGKGDRVASYSSYGSYIDLMAPGDSIYSLMPNGFWAAYKSGTSMSAPMVAAAAAYIKGINPGFSWQQVMQCLVQTADPIDALNDPRYTGKIGSGRINFERAALCAQRNAVSPVSIVPEKIYMYPNPADEIIRVDMGPSAPVLRNFKVYDINGRCIKTFQSNQTNIYFNTADLCPGIYILKIVDPGSERILKFLVSR